jgi:hypothetical protein
MRSMGRGGSSESCAEWSEFVVSYTDGLCTSIVENDTILVLNNGLTNFTLNLCYSITCVVRGLAMDQTLKVLWVILSS